METAPNPGHSFNMAKAKDVSGSALEGENQNSNTRRMNNVRSG